MRAKPHTPQLGLQHSERHGHIEIDDIMECSCDVCLFEVLDLDLGWWYGVRRKEEEEQRQKSGRGGNFWHHALGVAWRALIG